MNFIQPFERYIILFVILLTNVFFVNAQADLQLPKLLPSFSEDFSGYNTFPSRCFQNAFLDEQGKLWLQSCGVNMTSSLHLFQFDGYEFKLVRGALEELGHNSKITGVYKGRELVGFSFDPNDKRVFFFNFHNDSLSFHPVPTKGSGIRVLLSDDDKLMAVAEHAGQLLIYEWNDREWAFQTKVNDPYFEKPNKGGNRDLFQRQGEIYWKTFKNKDYIKRFDSKTNTVKIFTQKDFEGPKPENISLSQNGKLIFIQGTTYFKRVSGGKGKTQLFELDKSTDRFIINKNNRLEGWNLNNVFEDQIGNIIYLYKKGTNHSTAILKDRNGAKFDYSAFLPKDIAYNIHNIKSPDFKQQMLIFYQKGVIFHELKASNAIRHYLPDIPIRAMVELPDRQILVTTQTPAKSFLIDRKTGKVMQSADPDIRFGRTKASESCSACCNKNSPFCNKNPVT